MFCLLLQRSCVGLGVRQALPQSAENFALASYDGDTLCHEVLNPTERPLSYGQMVNLQFADVAVIGMAAVPYHVCTDARWTHHGFPQGPVDTYVWFHNPCEEPQTFSMNVTRLGDGARYPLMPCPAILRPLPHMTRRWEESVVQCIMHTAGPPYVALRSSHNGCGHYKLVPCQAV